MRKLAAILSHQSVRTHRDRNRTFGVAAQCETGHLQVGRFFLDPSGIGDHSRRASLQREEFDVGNGFEELQLILIERDS